MRRGNCLILSCKTGERIRSGWDTGPARPHSSHESSLVETASPKGKCMPHLFYNCSHHCHSMHLISNFVAFCARLSGFVDPKNTRARSAHVNRAKFTNRFQARIAWKIYARISARTFSARVNSAIPPRETCKARLRIRNSSAKIFGDSLARIAWHETCDSLLIRFAG